MEKYLRISALLIIVLLAISCNKKEEEIYQSTLWEQGVGNYNKYRIPSLIVTKKGSVLAFCEGRETGDTGDIDLLLKRSTDNGKTWSQEQVIWDDCSNTCGNPCPVIDEETGRVWLWMTWNNGKDNESKIVHGESISPRKPYLCYSDDDGLTWSEPVDMSESCKDTSWGWYATGPGIGIQIKGSKYKGRLVIPANHSYQDPGGNIRNGPYNYGAHVLYSDDHGQTWNKSQPITPGCNESQVVELSDGRLVMNMRSYNKKYSRAISYSNDGGQTWNPIQHDYQLVEPRCQASILYYGEHYGEELFLFSNPAVPIGRTHMSIKVSRDNCNTWYKSCLIYEGPSGYSCLTKLPNQNIGLLFECEGQQNYKTIKFVSIGINKLLGGEGTRLPAY